MALVIRDKDAKTNWKQVTGLDLVASVIADKIVEDSADLVGMKFLDAWRLGLLKWQSMDISDSSTGNFQCTTEFLYEQMLTAEGYRVWKDVVNQRINTVAVNYYGEPETYIRMWIGEDDYDYAEEKGYDLSKDEDYDKWLDERDDHDLAYRTLLFFNAMAGYCSCNHYDAWFKSVEEDDLADDPALAKEYQKFRGGYE